jgi:hypothetical protein
MELIHSYIVIEALGSEFDEYTYLPATGTRGGILLAWKSREVTITDPLFTTDALSAKVSVANYPPGGSLSSTAPKMTKLRSPSSTNSGTCALPAPPLATLWRLQPNIPRRG